MTQNEYDELRLASKKIKDPRVVLRISAVNMVLIHNCTIEETAGYIMRCPSWVEKWISRYKEGGLEALYDLPRSGRPAKVSQKIINKIISDADSRIIPKKFQNTIYEKTKIKYHITTIRKILHKNNMTSKVAKRIHINRASDEQISNWQKNTKRIISRLKKKNFSLVIQDESFFIHDPIAGNKYWVPKNTTSYVRYNGKHRKVIVYGAITDDDRRFFRIYDKFDGQTFLKYLKEMHRHFGKTILIMDKATQHRTEEVEQYLADNRKTLRVRYLPTATPDLSAIEEYWRQTKRDVLTSEYYGTFEHMRYTLSEYLRTKTVNLDVTKYLWRRIQTPTNL